MSARIKITLFNKSGSILGESRMSPRTSLVYEPEYQEGDYIVIETDTSPCFCVIQPEDSMPGTLVFIPGKLMKFLIPFGEKRMMYSPRSFIGGLHLISARIATSEEIARRKNMALNPFDQHGHNGFFPHAEANAETRGEAVFAARNVITGLYENLSHGYYPYLSWGIDCRADAELKIEFGRPVMIDEAILTLRAGFPHDNYWTQVSMEFSDGNSMTVQLEKSAESQSFKFEPKKTDWVLLKNLIPSDAPSLYPSLTQLEYWGIEVK